MGKPCKQEKTEDKPKNIKNVYLTKINSLIKISRDNLAEEDLDIFSQTKTKKIKKSQSDMDNTTLKLQKNRQAARKARQRKNLYIKLLENQVKNFNSILSQGSKVEKESTQLLQTIQHKYTKQDQLDKYISNEDLSIFNTEKTHIQNKTKCSQFLMHQIQNSFFPNMLKGITSLSSAEAKETERLILSRLDHKNSMTHEERAAQKQALRILMHTVKIEKEKTDRNFLKLEQLTEKLEKLIKSAPVFPLHHHEDQIYGDIREIAENLVLVDQKQGIFNAKVPQQKFMNGISLEENEGNQILVETQHVIDKLNKFENFVADIGKIE